MRRKRKAPGAAKNTTTDEPRRLANTRHRTEAEGKPVPYEAGRLYFRGVRLGLRHSLTFQTVQSILFENLALICFPGTASTGPRGAHNQRLANEPWFF